MSQKPKHIVWFICDQLRADALGFMGNNIVRTPNIDRLANKGIIFDNMFTSHPTCMPSRASMLTGRYPNTLRMENGSPLLDPRETTLPEVLQRAGYRTGMFGKLHITPQEYTRDVLKSDRPIADASLFSDDAGLVPIKEDPFKKNYGFQTVVGFEDALWGEYIDWLECKDAKLASRFSKSPGGKFSEIASSEFPDLPNLGDIGKSIIPPELHPSYFIAESAIKFFKENCSKGHCFMEVSFVDPHHPWDPPAELAKKYSPKDMPLPKHNTIGNVKLPNCLKNRWQFGVGHIVGIDPEVIRTIIAYYYAMIEMIDIAIGRVIQAIEEAGEFDDTLFVFVADHGEHLGSYGLIRKGTFHYDHLIRQPCFLTWENSPFEAKRIDALCQGLDIMPTILSLSDLPIPAGVQGIDLVPVISSGASGRDAIYVQSCQAPIGPFVNCMTIRNEIAKFNYFPDDNVGHLFDLREDPDEMNDVFDDVRYRELRDEMIFAMIRHLHSQKDPLPIVLSNW